MNLQYALLVCLFLIPSTTCGQDPAVSEPVQVFLLAGQSNMQGQGAVEHFTHLINDSATRDAFCHLQDEQGQWVQRDDVFVFCIGRDKKGRLSTGFGANEEKIGPELGFGTVTGNALDAPVLIIKTCWGGRSLRKDYLPPSSGGPGDAWTELVDQVHQVLDTPLGETFPELNQREFRLAGFVWFQGWNDMVDGEQRDEKYTRYTRNLANLIRDLRTEFNAPELPVVIGELGVGGPDRRGEFQTAQEAVSRMEEFQGTVGFAKTCEIYDMAIHQLYEDDVWKGPDKDIYYRVGSDRPYHYLGSGKIYYQMGEAFGNKMLELVGDIERTDIR